jgi:hypothetical protein
MIRRTMSPTRLMKYMLVGCAVQAWPAFGQEAILPHGDPRLQADSPEEQRRAAARDHRLKQQGQGSNYRIEGEPQPSAGHSEPATGESPGLARQDTGLEDPSVNPGQASGMRSVQGRIVQSDADTHILRQISGGDTTLVVDAGTAGDRDLQPGDVITGIITSQGRAVAIQKTPKPSAR